MQSICNINSLQILFKKVFEYGKEIVVSEEDSQEPLKEDDVLLVTMVYDLSNIESGKAYEESPYLFNVSRDENGVHAELLNHYDSDTTDESILFPEWVEITTEDESSFDISTAIQLKEVPLKEEVIPESIILKAQVDALIAESEFKDALIQDLILEVYK